MLKEIDRLFLEAIKASLHSKCVDWTQDISVEDWGLLLDKANEHNILPLIYESVFRSESFQRTGGSYVAALKNQSMRTVFLQIQKTQEFLRLYQALGEKDLRPVVVKGLVCRNLYPNPDLRPSNDEDLFVPSGDYADYYQTLTDYGMVLDGEKEDEGEACYYQPGGCLFIEVHRDLMDLELSSIMDMNKLFEGAFDRTIELDIDGSRIRTLCHSDHMLFLVLHAFKHFVTGGFGIRQVVDMILFAQRYGSEIDWTSVMERCKSFRADQFALALLDIGDKYFDFDYAKACFPLHLQDPDIDSMPLLDDLLDAGLYGASTMSRKHSSGITLNTLQAQYEGRSGGGIRGSLFPPKERMLVDYPYLERHGWMLPIAWMQRIFRYVKETGKENSEANSAAEAIKIGNERVELMRKYGILTKGKNK